MVHCGSKQDISISSMVKALIVSRKYLICFCYFQSNMNNIARKGFSIYPQIIVLMDAMPISIDNNPKVLREYVNISPLKLFKKCFDRMIFVYNPSHPNPVYPYFFKVALDNRNLHFKRSNKTTSRRRRVQHHLIRLVNTSSDNSCHACLCCSVPIRISLNLFP
jgi:hypothetical protein